MNNTVALLKASISGILSGISLEDEVTNLDQGIERGLRVMSIKIDMPEAIANEAITLYSGVTDYLSPDSIFGTALVDMRPQGDSRSFNDYVYKKGIEVFDRTKNLLPSGYMVTFENNKSVAIMRVSQNKTLERSIIDTMADDTGWTAAGSASHLVVDETVYYNSPSSLRFLLTGASTGTLTKNLTNSIDLTDYEDVAVAFLAIRIPDGATATNLTSISLKLGSSALAYDIVSTTQGFLGAWVAGDWLLVALDFSTALSTGTPSWSAIDYAQVSIVHAATLTNFRVGGLWISLPSPHKVYFQSAAVFQASGQNPLPTITSDNDTILLNDAAYTILEYESANAILLQSGGGVGSEVYTSINQVLHGVRARNGAVITAGLYDHYAADNPSQEIRSTDNYYLD